MRTNGFVMAFAGMMEIFNNQKGMTREEAYNQYYHEVALFEQWGSKNTTTFDEWLEIKNIKLDEEPQGLDEAATEYAWEKQEHHIDFDGEEYLDYGPRYDAFKAGAKWDSEQGVSYDSTVVHGTNDMLFVTALLDGKDFKEGDKVIVQIRKK